MMEHWKNNTENTTPEESTPMTEQTEECEDYGQHWFSDDFENTVRNAVPKAKSIVPYRPKVKKKHTFFRSPAFAAILSSCLTAALCLGLFAVIYKPPVLGEALPQTGGAAGTKQSAPTTQIASSGSTGTISPAVATSTGALTIPQVYDKASPSVVSILCQSQSNMYLQSQTAMSTGSGIIIREDGYIVTNNHVVEDAAKITVTTSGGEELDAEIVGTDSRTDIAVLKVEAEQALPFAELGDSSTLHVGDMALAIGNPLRVELAGTLTVGYISAINRSMMIDDKQMTMIQTDAAINPGNSGGALLNIYGQVIGINTAKSTGYDVEGLGFAIPINEVKPVIESLINNGYVTGRPLIGLTGRSVTEAISKAQDIPIGVYVADVIEYGAAEKAGIRPGDVIVECEGTEVTTVDEINKIRDSHKPGDTIEMKLNRNGRTMTVSLVLQEEKPEDSSQQQQQQQQQQYTPQIPSEFYPWFGW